MGTVLFEWVFPHEEPSLFHHRWYLILSPSDVTIKEKQVLAVMGPECERRILEMKCIVKIVSILMAFLLLFERT